MSGSYDVWSDIERTVVVCSDDDATRRVFFLRGDCELVEHGVWEVVERGEGEGVLGGWMALLGSSWSSTTRLRPNQPNTRSLRLRRGLELSTETVAMMRLVQFFAAGLVGIGRSKSTVAKKMLPQRLLVMHECQTLIVFRPGKK